MVTASESQAALRLVTAKAVEQVDWVLRRSDGSFQERRLILLETVPAVVEHYGTGAAALAADFYDDSRSAAKVKTRYRSEVVIPDRTVKVRRGVAWASGPLKDGQLDDAAARFSELVSGEVPRPYRDTIITNTRKDPAAAGWKRIAHPGACAFCRMLADRGAVYKEDTAIFASHPNCSCTAAAAWYDDGAQMGPEASVMQYIGSRRSKSQKDRERLHDYLAANYGD